MANRVPTHLHRIRHTHFNKPHVHADRVGAADHQADLRISALQLANLRCLIDLAKFHAGFTKLSKVNPLHEVSEAF
jgi:hypothetical protein